MNRNLEGITFLQGDATNPKGEPNTLKIIAHIGNDVGRWGAGFTGALDRTWPFPRRDYMELWEQYRALGRIPMGTTIMTKIRPPELWVYTMIVQAGVGRGKDRVDYVQLDVCLTQLAAAAKNMQEISEMAPEVHMPKIGSGLAGGNWAIIDTIIKQTLARAGVAVYVYEFDA